MDDQYEKMTQEELDEAVHEAKAGEAAMINNAGRACQLAYLRGEDQTYGEHTL